MALSQKARVLLVGSGGVGTMATYAIEKGGKASVAAVLRSNYARVNEKGFDLDTWYDGKVTGWKPTQSESVRLSSLIQSPTALSSLERSSRCQEREVHSLRLHRYRDQEHP